MAVVQMTDGKAILRGWLTYIVNLLVVLPALLSFAVWVKFDFKSPLLHPSSPIGGLLITIVLIVGFRHVLLAPRKVKRMLEWQGVDELTKTNEGWAGRYGSMGVRVRCREPFMAFNPGWGPTPRHRGPRGKKTDSCELNPLHALDSGGVLIWDRAGGNNLVDEAENIAEERILAEAALGPWMTRWEGRHIIEKTLQTAERVEARPEGQSSGRVRRTTGERSANVRRPHEDTVTAQQALHELDEGGEGAQLSEAERAEMAIKAGIMTCMFSGAGLVVTAVVWIFGETTGEHSFNFVNQVLKVAQEPKLLYVWIGALGIPSFLLFIWGVYFIRQGQQRRAKS
jgi:hypothetical protein